MKLLIASTLGALLLVACTAEKKNETVTADTTGTTVTSQTVATETVATTATEPAATASATETADNENQSTATWAGQIKVAQPVSMFNYVGEESGDWAPMRFRNDSEVGKKILAVCANDDLCEFTGTVEWLDETPPPNASAIGQIVRVDSVKRLPARTP